MKFFFKLGAFILGVAFLSFIVSSPVEASTKCNHVGAFKNVGSQAWVCLKVNGKFIFVKVAAPKSKSKTPPPRQSSWIEYVACLDSYKSSAAGAVWAISFCDPVDPSRGIPIKSYAEYLACQQFSAENPINSIFIECSRWRP